LIAYVQWAISMKSFGDRLREARIAAGMTQEQLGFALGVTKASVSAWENGREFPSFRLLPELRCTLRRPLDELICGTLTESSEGSDKTSSELMPKNIGEKTLLVRFRGLPVRKREAFLELLKPSRRREE
jgi:transcriptional regulator with XRE-family HTH domain